MDADTLQLSGYQTDLKYLASRYKQGGRTVYSLDLSPTQIVGDFPKPDPDSPAEHNRRIKPKHAEEFAQYVRERESWVAPSITLRADQTFDFQTEIEVGGAQFGVLTIPRRNLDMIHIVDGQHRILGFQYALNRISADRERARGQLQRAKRNDPGGRAETDAQQRLAELDSQIARLENERLAVQIHVEPDPIAFRQMFYDIADNALNITASVRSRFDSTKVINRALPTILDHSLLKGRVELEVDRIGIASPMFLSAKNVAEISKNVLVGMRGRMGRRTEAELNEKSVADRVSKFFDTLTTAFPPLHSLEYGQITPQRLRSTSLLGSTVMLRIMAGLYHDLMDSHGFTRKMVEEFFTTLAPHMSSDGPAIYPGSIWVEHSPVDELFRVGTSSPGSRHQDQKAVLDMLTEWAILKPAFLTEPPKPRPEPQS